MKPIKGTNRKEILEKFTSDLEKISQAFSEMEMYKHHARLDQWIDMQNKNRPSNEKPQPGCQRKPLKYWSLQTRPATPLHVPVDDVDG